MKILFTGVYPHLYGGLERFAERAAAALRAAGHTVDVVGDPPSELDDRDFVLMQKIPPTVADLKRLKSRYGERLHFYAHDHELYCLRRHYYDPLRRLCDRTYSFFPCRVCAAVTRSSYLKRNITRPLCAFLDEMRDVKAFVPAKYIKDNLVKNGFRPERVKVLYPLFTHSFREEAAAHRWMPEGKLRILFMGQLIAGKGAGLLIEAARLMKVQRTLTIAGAGRDEEKLRSRSPEGVDFLGWQENAQRFFKDADVCALPSLWNEPFGTVGAEALSHGVPVVTFDVGGLSDWLVDGRTGLFAKAPDGATRVAAARTPAAFAAALDAIADSARLAEMGTNALDIVDRLFDPGNFMKELLQW
ncbi:MAG: glycosyltransferase family 4 protein [Kiritimatiellae bacterium]|nr:glycosyltransferase family 4 protein [Kiritimatiellia bacterium]